MVSLRTTLLMAAAAGMVFTTAGTATAEPAVYKIDAVHSSVLWKINHMNASNAYGRFNALDGKIVLDEADASRNQIEVTVKADSIDSANEKRDQHLKGPDFLNAKQFPEIAIKSDKVAKVDDSTYAVDGTLTLRGVTKPVSFKIKRTGTTKHPKSGKEVTGGEAEFTIKRSDFGINYMPQALGEEITIIASIEAAKE